MITEKILIDGNNLLYKLPQTQPLMPDHIELARQKLEIQVRRAFAGRNIQIKIIFDGHSPDHFNQRGKIQSAFAEGDGNADRALINFLKKQKRHRQWTVVSSDNEVRMRAANLDANVISSEQFAEKLNSRTAAQAEDLQKSNPKLSRKEIDEWLDLFSREDD